MNDEIIEEFKCAFSNEKHFLIKPISLTCGHYVCQKCIPHENIKEIKCKICDVISIQDFKSFSVSKLAQNALNFLMGEIFHTLERETSDHLNHLKGKK